jgi:hypothetical protein
VPQARLATARLTLVPLSDDHLEHEVALDADPEVMRYLGARGRTGEEVVVVHRSRLARAGGDDGLGMWAGFVGSDGEEFAGLWMLTAPTARASRRNPVPPTSATGSSGGSGDRGWPLREQVSWSGTGSRTSVSAGSSPRRWRSTPGPARREPPPG